MKLLGSKTPCRENSYRLAGKVTVPLTGFGAELRKAGRAQPYLLPFCEYVNTRKLSKPTEVPRALWRKALQDAWLNQSPMQFTGDVDFDWAAFCALAEHMHVDALRTLGYTSPNKGSARSKGSFPKVRLNAVQTVRAKQQISFRERSLRKLLGQALEAKRQSLALRRPKHCSANCAPKTCSPWSENPSLMVFLYWKSKFPNQPQQHPKIAFMLGNLP